MGKEILVDMSNELPQLQNQRQLAPPPKSNSAVNLIQHESGSKAVESNNQVTPPISGRNNKDSTNSPQPHKPAGLNVAYINIA